MKNALTAIQKATQNWLEEIVIGFNFCPFAKHVWLQNKVAYHICTNTTFEDMLQALVQACQELDEQEAIETTLLIFPKGVEEFETYLDLLSVAEQLLEDLNYTGVYQLASFHPEYVFGGSTTQDSSNYTNRSPYPMLHLIREASIEKALEAYDQPEEIPNRNIAVANSKSLDTWKALLAACYPTSV